MTGSNIPRPQDRFRCAQDVSLTFELLVNPSDSVLEPVHKELVAFNRAAVGDQEYARLAVVVTDNDQLAGGAYGDLLWDWLHIEVLWMAGSLRGQGIGARILRQIEDAAVARGVTRAHVETTTFQASGFYTRQGYIVFGQLDGKPEGHTMYFMKKDRLKQPQPLADHSVPTCKLTSSDPIQVGARDTRALKSIAGSN